MSDAQFVAGSVAGVLILAILCWEWDKYRERKEAKRRRAGIKLVEPHLNKYERGGWLL